jgi:putative molybdopterin biosynthesis protein
MVNKLLYTIPEVAEITGYSRSFIYELINKGSLPVIRVGRTARVAADGLDGWIEAQHAVLR